MAVLLNPVCILLSEMLYVYKSEVRVAVFETYDFQTLALIDPTIENRKIVWTCSFEAAESKVE